MAMNTAARLIGLAASALTWGAAAACAQSGGCALDEHGAPTTTAHYHGVALGPATGDEVRSQTAIAVKRAGAPISPAYVNLPRIDAIYLANGARHVTIAAIVDGVVPRKGDAVVLAARHRDPDTACSFVPWTVVPGTPGVAWERSGRAGSG
jgi:hypothetical protein